MARRINLEIKTLFRASVFDRDWFGPRSSPSSPQPPSTLANRRFSRFFSTPFRTGLMTVVDWCGSYITWKSAINCEEYSPHSVAQPSPRPLVPRLTSHANIYARVYLYMIEGRNTPPPPAHNDASIKIPNPSMPIWRRVKNKLRVINDPKAIYTFTAGFLRFIKTWRLTSPDPRRKNNNL